MLLALLLTASAAPSDGPVDGADAPASRDQPTRDLASDLAAAKEAYLLGEIDLARAAFREVADRADIDPDAPPSVWADAWIFLGEIAWLAGDLPAAEGIFRMVAQRVPDHRISPYDHPLEVVGAFEVARAAITAQRDQPVVEVRTRPLPWWGYAPLGVPQFRQQRPVRGALYATLQVGAAAASVGAWVAIDRSLRDFDTLDEASQETARARALLQRDAWSIPTAVAFYVVWGVSVLDGGLTWRRDQAPPPMVSLTPQRGGAAIGIAGRF